jgi:hypothetical protein
MLCSIFRISLLALDSVTLLSTSMHNGTLSCLSDVFFIYWFAKDSLRMDITELGASK